jgi:putative effector of murein hydrolase LrgA (UPF0299 family)
MEERHRSIAVAVSIVGLVLLLLIQVLSWRKHGRLNSGAFLLLIPIMSPLFVKSRTPPL